MGPRLRSIAPLEFLKSSHFWNEQCAITSRDHPFCICAEGTLQATESIKWRPDLTKQAVLSSNQWITKGTKVSVLLHRGFGNNILATEFTFHLALSYIILFFKSVSLVNSVWENYPESLIWLNLLFYTCHQRFGQVKTGLFLGASPAFPRPNVRNTSHHLLQWTLQSSSGKYLFIVLQLKPSCLWITVADTR